MKLRWAILGTGFVAKKFVLGLRASTRGEAVAVGSRTHERALQFAKTFGIQHSYGSYEAAAASPEVDAVYIATPPGRHGMDARLAIEAGKHLLVEKPFAPDATQGREIIEAARARGVFCMEAMWTRFLPAVRWVKSQLSEGRLGDLQMMTGSFGIAESFPPGHWMLDPSQGGGALLDRGIYPLSLARHFAGEAASDLQCQAVLGPSGTDEQVTALLRFGAGTLASIHTTLRAVTANDFHIYGSKGSIVLQAPIYRPYRVEVQHYAARTAGPPAAPSSWKDTLRESGWTHRLVQRAQGIRDVAGALGPRTIPYAGNGYGHQADEVARCIAGGHLESRVMPQAQTLELLELMDRIRSTWTLSSSSGDA